MASVGQNGNLYIPEVLQYRMEVGKNGKQVCVCKGC